MKRILTAILATCAWAAAVSSGHSQTVIRIAWAALPPELVPVMFTKPGLATHLGKTYTFQPTRFSTSPLMVTALATQDIDIAPLTSLAFATAIQNAKMDDLRIIADQVQDGANGFGSSGFFVLKGGDVKTVADLKGKTVAVMGIGSAGDLGVRAMLAKQGLQFRRDYNTVEARPQNLGPMLTEKKVDLIAGPISLAFEPDIRDKAQPLFSSRDAIGKSQLSFFVARRKFVDDNRAVLVDFYEDWIRATRWFTDPKNHDEAVKIVADFTKDDATRLGAWLFTEKDVYRDKDGKPDITALQSTMDILKQQGLITSELKVANYVDASIVDAAASRLKP